MTSGPWPFFLESLEHVAKRFEALHRGDTSLVFVLDEIARGREPEVQAALWNAGFLFAEQLLQGFTTVDRDGADAVVVVFRETVDALRHKLG